MKDAGVTVAADYNSRSDPRGQNERAEESRSKQPGHTAGRDCIPGHRGGQFAAQSVVRPAEPQGKRPERSLANDSPDKPPRVLPNTYWSRKGGGWILEFKKKVKREWRYEYYGLLKLETWNQLKGRYQDERLKGIIKGIIGAKRAELQRARGSRPGQHRLRLVGKRG